MQPQNLQILSNFHSQLANLTHANNKLIDFTTLFTLYVASFTKQPLNLLLLQALKAFSLALGAMAI